MSDDSLKSLPGAEIVLPGLADLQAGRQSINASAVQRAAPRLRRVGLNVPSATGDIPAAHASIDGLFALRYRFGHGIRPADEEASERCGSRGRGRPVASTA